MKNLYASLLIDILRYLGKKVPQDISVVGFDDSIVAVAGAIKLATVAHPKFSYGARVANALGISSRARSRATIRNSWTWS